MIPADPELDVLIVGGGLTGAVLALALTNANAGLRIGLLDAAPGATDAVPSFDERVLALSEGSRRLLVQLGIWPALQPDANPIQHIHVSDRGQFGRTVMHASEHGVAALGHVVALRVIGRALYTALAERTQIRRLSGKVTSLQQEPDAVRLQLQQEQSMHALTARVVLAADGGPSSVRTLAGLPVVVDDYQQSALISTVRTECSHGHWAYERFTCNGPLALLPMTNDRLSLVWTQTAPEAARLLFVSESEFLAELQQAFGWRLGKFVQVGIREKFELKRVRSLVRRQGRLLLMGNAATTLHPIAGQGFNLALRDAMAFANHLRQGPLTWSTPEQLDAFVRARQQDGKQVANITDGLVRLFSNEHPLLAPIRAAALTLLDTFPIGKRLLARRAMGLPG